MIERGEPNLPDNPRNLRIHFFATLAERATALAERTKNPKRKAALLAVAAAITAAIKGGAFGGG